MNKEKKTVIISLSAFVAIIVIGFVYAQFFLFSHQLPEADDKLMLSDTVKETIQENVNNGKYQSLFVGIIDGDDVNYYYYGNTAKDGNPIDENTIFEIGSITKVFTALLLADLVEKGELNLDAPIEQFLPEYVATPSKNGKNITLLDLATHTSGLPVFPDDFPFPDDFSIPDSDAMYEYEREEMYDFLSNVEISREIGSRYEYSNIGMALLGHIISLQAGQPYEELVKERILDKLGMKSTCIKQCDKLRDNFAKPHDPFGSQTGELNLSEDMVGGGEIRSSGKDMLIFLSYTMGLKESSLKNSFELTQTSNHKIDHKSSVGLAWHITQDDGRKVISHGGVTNGFSSFVGFDSDSKEGVVVLTNNSHVPVSEIGLEILESGVEE